MTEKQRWDDGDTQGFLELADLTVPSRAEQYRLICDLIPATQDEWFLGVDIACGDGELSHAILERFPEAQMTLLDGSEQMLTRAAENLATFAYQIDLRQFDLRETGWLDELSRRNRCIVSSLAIHHLDDDGKQALYQRLAGHLAPGGVLLIVDIVHHPNEWVRDAWANEWDRDVREQSVARTGDLSAFEHFQDGWNHYRTPDFAFDKPSRLIDQLRWLEDAGLEAVDCYWLRAGHALFGGFKPQ
jgi:tRNA (cmo5U34)-methyltransferase